MTDCTARLGCPGDMHTVDCPHIVGNWTQPPTAASEGARP